MPLLAAQTIEVLKFYSEHVPHSARLAHIKVSAQGAPVHHWPQHWQHASIEQMPSRAQ
eukprot:CAMPEP_0115883180 /NCGR_PEP_ID=MMETSP0287-20121206/29428_1 /TAXON_ID=412157 /ORGANISM="Chrysochromulina rotalis, Strain UIO044" /LENGTH=57 /DNA_ID=CAMNT_0003339363 /DNA_START=478 /DNA_END=651 /DNA_ORIENTATION=-